MKKQLLRQADGSPWIAIAGEAHNSSASDAVYMSWNLGKGRRTGIEYTAPSGELGTDRAGGKQV